VKPCSQCGQASHVKPCDEVRGACVSAATVMRGIVEDLTKSKPAQGIYNGGHEVETCALCGATGEYEDELYLAGLRIEHKPSCPWRRATEFLATLPTASQP
jgi:hypothetical protein